MIKIGSKSNLNQLASQHWTWLEEKLMLKSSYLDLVREYRRNPSNAVKKNRILRKMLSPKVFGMLHDIITKDKKFLLSLKKDPDFIYFFPYDDEYLHCAQREYNEAKKTFDEYKRLLPKKKKTEKDNDFCNLKNDKNTKKANLDKKRKLYDKDSKDFAKKRKAATNARVFLLDKSGNLKNRKEIVDLIDLLRYDELHSNDEIWNANLLCESLDVHVCPYCNRQYIFVAKKTNEKGWISSAQLDHFLPKSNYPLFSNSFFNLIPSCYCCNHGKSNDVSETIYPYDEEFGDDGRFALDFIRKDKGKIEDIPLESLIGIDFDIDKKSAYYVKIENSKNVFHLTELYSKHQLDIKDFIKRYRYLKSLTLDNAQLLNDQLDIFFGDEKESVILGLPLDSSDMEYPLRKMKHDLLKQFKDG